MRPKISVLAVAFALAAIILSDAAFAVGRTYVDKRREISAGVLVMDNESTAPNPHIFYIMGMRDDLKPSGWTFVNPLMGGADAYKNAAGYWYVPLKQTTLDNLAKFDVLYLTGSQMMIFQMNERDKLRRFVDAGGCLWVDDAGGNPGLKFSNDPGEAFFLPGVNFVSSASTNPTRLVMARLHPLLTTPFWLSAEEVSSLDYVTSSGFYTIDPGFPKDFSSIPSPTILNPIVVASDGMSGALPTIAAIDYGSGRVVFTSGSIGAKIEGPTVGWSLNPPAFLNDQNSNPYYAAASNLRFAYNVVGWASSSPTYRKNYRRAGSSLESFGAPLVNKWTLPGAAPTVDTESSPAIYKNVIFYSSGSTLYALDASPETDLDMDGNPDDGEQSSSTANADIIWKATLPTEISSPTIASMLDPKGGGLAPRDFVLVSGRDGNVYIFEAFPQTSDGRLSGAPEPRQDLWASTAGASGGGALSSPIVQNGWIVNVAPNGIISGHSPVLAAAGGQPGIPSTPWDRPLVVDPAGTGAAATVRPGHAFGFMKSPTSGAIVQNLLVAARPPGFGYGAAPINDTIYALPIFVSSERLTPANPRTMMRTNPGDVIPFNRPYGAPIPSEYPKPDVWAVDYEPDLYGNLVSVSIPVSLVDYPTAANPQGLFNIRVEDNRFGPNTRVYISYAADHAATQALLSGVSTSFIVPPVINNPGSGVTVDVSVTASPSMGSDDSIYCGIKYGSTSGTGKSSVYSMTFDGRNTVRLNWNYFLHGGGPMPDPTIAPGTNIGGNLLLAEAHPKAWGVHAKSESDGTIYPVSDLLVESSPAVTSDRVFVTASVDGPGSPGVSKGFLLCFKAKPDFVIRANQPLKDIDSGARFRVKIWQPDFLFNPTLSISSPLLTAATVPPNMIDYDNGTITITDFSKLRMRGAQDGTTQTGTITPSLPVWLFVENTPVSPIDLDLTQWDNMLWSLALPSHNGTPCSGVHSSPVVLGDYVYFTCDDGYMYAVSVDAEPADAKNLRMLDPTDSNASTWLAMNERVDPTAGAGGGKVSIAGAGGTIAIPTGSGLYAFGNPMTLVTDNRRVLEIGGDGKVAWSCDSVIEPTEVAGVASPSAGIAYFGSRVQPLMRPIVAQRLGPSDYLVVDSGNDRVIRIDRGGTVLWSLRKFEDPDGILRSGEPKSVKAPRDARTWGEYEQVGGSLRYVIHTIVVDAGNFRILDIVDRFETQDGQIGDPVRKDGSPRPKDVHELNWVSSSSYRDKNLAFASVQLIRGLDNGTEIGQIWAAVSNYGFIDGLSGVMAPGGGRLGGAIVTMNYRSRAENSQEWSYADGKIANQLSVIRDQLGRPRSLSGPNYFAVLDSTLPKLLICDSSSVYITEGANGSITWEFGQNDYNNLSRVVYDDENNSSSIAIPIPFTPQRAQMLPSGRMLIVNSYAGRTDDPYMPKFVGEVIEIDSNNACKWYTPDILRYHDTGELVQQMKNAPNLDQPTCAQRLY